jgi:hypothetical protein
MVLLDQTIPRVRTKARIAAVIRVIEDQITTRRPYNARYTGDHRSIFRRRYAEMITRVSLVRCGRSGLAPCRYP